MKSQRGGFFLGVIVGGMIVALYLPIFNIINLVQQ